MTQFPLQLTLCACGLHRVKDVIESFLCLVLRWRLMQSGVCTRKLVHRLAIWTTIAETISVSVFYFVTSSDSSLIPFFPYIFIFRAKTLENHLYLKVLQLIFFLFYISLNFYSLALFYVQLNFSLIV